jgi:hypothetical protein
MELREAYKVLELEPGASEEAVRDARKTLVKVWHPDRHTNDPELQKRAEIKLAEINAAFEAVRAAGFPAVLPIAKPAEPPPKAAPAPVPPVQSKIEIVPRRRVRWGVIVLMLAAVGAGAYFAIAKLGSESTPAVVAAPRDAPLIAMPADGRVEPPPAPPEDAAALAVAAPDAAEPNDAAEIAIAPLDAPSTYTPPKTGATFGLGATHEEVLAAQGKPTARQTVATEEWSYGYSIVTFNKRGKVVGWWDRDDVLNVKLVPSDPDASARAKAAGGYGMGASKDEVIGVQGTPNRIESVVDETWYFGKASSLTFNGTGRITGYHNVNNELSLQ